MSKSFENAPQSSRDNEAMQGWRIRGLKAELAELRRELERLREENVALRWVVASPQWSIVGSAEDRFRVYSGVQPAFDDDRWHPTEVEAICAAYRLEHKLD
jgi:hypothetical protein